MVADGNLEVHVHGRYQLAAAGEAHRELENGSTIGKLLLVMDDDA
jgi:NADPH:quinone reductase-like Zn-dependent oxidoreductase